MSHSPWYLWIAMYETLDTKTVDMGTWLYGEKPRFPPVLCLPVFPISDGSNPSEASEMCLTQPAESSWFSRQLLTWGAAQCLTTFSLTSKQRNLNLSQFIGAWSLPGVQKLEMQLSSYPDQVTNSPPPLCKAGFMPTGYWKTHTLLLHVAQICC